jgi:hypothetical protein
VFEKVIIKERSFIARIAAEKLRCHQVAIVIGKSIHLHNTSKQEFISNAGWVRHEMVHIDQFRRYGNLKFVLLYIIESIRKGYWNNRFEVEARRAETNESIQLPQTEISVQ